MTSTRLLEPGFASKLQKPVGRHAAASKNGYADRGESLPPIGRPSADDRSAGSLPPIGRSAEPCDRTSLLQRSGHKRSASIGHFDADGTSQAGSLPPLPRIAASDVGGGARPPRPDNNGGYGGRRPNSRQRAQETPPQSSPQKFQKPDPRGRRCYSRGQVEGMVAQSPSRPGSTAPFATDAIEPSAQAPRLAHAGNRGNASRVDGGEIVDDGTQGYQRPAPRASSRRPGSRDVEGTPAATGALGGKPPRVASRQRVESNGAAAGARSPETDQPPPSPPVPVQRRPLAQRDPSPKRAAAPRRPPAAPPPDAAQRVASPPVPAAQRPASPPIGTKGAGVSPFEGGGYAFSSEEFTADQYSDNEPLMPCRHCNRKFRAEALERHLKICVKVFQQQRKKFNALEKALPEEAKALTKKPARTQKKTSQQQRRDEKPITGGQAKSHWRQKSEAFRAAIKDARMVDKFKKEGRPMSELPPPRQTAPELDDRIPCPHCGRRFGQQQAERHIPHCKNTKAKPNAPPQARIQKPPPMRASKAR